MSTFLNCGSAAFNWVLQTSWQAAVLACLIILGHTVFRKRISPAWRYGLWSLLLVRLLMPFPPQSALSIFRVARLEAPRQLLKIVPQRTSVSADSTASETSIPANLPASAIQTESRVSTLPVTPTLQIEQPNPSAGYRWNLTWLQLGAVIWLLGVACWSTRLFWTNLRFLSRIKCGVPISDPEILNDFTDCLEVFRIKQRVELIETAAVDSPAVYGLWQKRLLLPQGILNRFSPRELHYVLLHELAHIKRRDLELNWLAVILQVLHWFNPVLWIAFARIRADRELATDALALSRAKLSENTQYGETIIKLAEWFVGPKTTPALVGIAEDKVQIKRRIVMIANAHRKRSWPVVSVAMLLVVAVLALTDSPDSTPEAPVGLPGDALAEVGASPNAAKLIATLKQKSRWTFGPKAVLFGDEDGEVSAGFVRSVQLRGYTMTAEELGSLGGPSADGLPPTASGAETLQWNFQNDLKSIDGRVTLVPKAVVPASTPNFAFVEAPVLGGNATVMSFSAGTCFELSNPFKDPSGSASILDYTVIMDVMFPDMKSRWAALWQTDPQNRSDAEWLISTEKGIGITDTYGGRIQPGEWHRVALVLRGSDATFLSYIDGKEVQRKYLDVKDEFYNRRRDDDVLSWTDTFAKLRNLGDSTAATAVTKFNIRLENSLRRSRSDSTKIITSSDLMNDTVGQVAAAKTWAAVLPTADLATALEMKSRWTLGPRALLFADENGENAGGLVNAVQVRNYAMTDDEVGMLAGAAAELPLPAQLGSGLQVAQWDFRGDLASSTGGAALIPRACSPASRAEVTFESLDAGSTQMEVARFTRGTSFELTTGFDSPDGSPGCLNYSVIMDVKLEDRPVGWVSLWQNDFRNHTDADWFIDKKKELGIRDLYGGSVEDGAWNRLALVIDGKNGTICHFINGKKVRTKLMILEDDFGRRGGAEYNLNSIVGLISELGLRNDPRANSLVQTFSRRMHNHPDPDSTSRSVPFDVQLTDESTGKSIAAGTIVYQMGESSEEFFPESMKADSSGKARIMVPIPVADRVHVTARAHGFSPSSVVVSGADIFSGAKKSVQLALSRGIKIGGVVTDLKNAPVPNAQIRIQVDSPVASASEVQAWNELIQTGEDGGWTADFVPAKAEKLTIIIYHQLGPPEAVVLSRADPGFEDLTKLTANFQFQATVK
jgi:beta-lactamase regulating signal transducer with metallopeptidase domain